MKHITLAVACLLLLSVAPLSAFAARFEAAELLSISPKEVVQENLYMAGGQANFSSTAQKDLFIAGGKVLVDGSVWGDVAAAGGTVDLLEAVRGDVRVAGGQVTVKGTISGDLIVAGGSVTILPGATVSGDLVVMGGLVIMDGVVNGTARLYAGEAHINGTAGGPMIVYAQEKVAFGSAARIGSTLEYHAPQTADVATGAVVGDQVTFTPLTVPKADAATFGLALLAAVTVVLILKFFALAVASIGAAFWLRHPAQALVDRSLHSFLPMLGLGFAAMIGGPILSIALILSVAFTYLGFALLALYGFLVTAAIVLESLLVGALIAKAVRREARVTWKWALLGAAVVCAVGLVPLVGWAATGIVFFVAFGSLVEKMYRALKGLTTT